MTATKEQLTAAVRVVLAVAETIRELGEMPSGHLYTILMGSMSLDQYQAIIRTLKRQGLVTESNHLLTWAGPAK